MKKLLASLFLTASWLCAQNAWINEFHYDNTGTDEGEMIEVVIENSASYNLADFEVIFYNGNNGASYGTLALNAFTAGIVSDNFSFFSYTYSESNKIQNGPPDGIALSYQGKLLNGHFISYEGAFAASGGVADGLTSTDIGVSEAGTEPIGQSLQLGGSGSDYASFSWQAAQTATPGAINTGQSFSAPSPEPSNHATGFAVESTTNTTITLTWTGATGSQLPHKYLILAKLPAAEFPAIQDGVFLSNNSDWADSVAVFNVSHTDGKNTYTVSGLASETGYDFVIFSYTNAGANTNYKTDGSIPSASGTTLSTPTFTIAQIQTTANGEEGDSPYKGQIVKTSGIVTAKSSAGYFIEDASAIWSAVYIFDSANLSKIAAGDEIDLIGTVDEYNGMTEIKNVLSLTVLSGGNELPAPLVIPTGALAHEKYEGLLVQVKHALCTNADAGSGEWQVNDGSGVCTVDDWLFAYTPTAGLYYDITGVVNCYTTFKLEPRSAEDIDLFSTAPKIINLAGAITVPAANQDFPNRVQVTDNGSLTHVEMRYTVNGGTVKVLIMSQAENDSTYTATIPESDYGDADIVEYWVFAQDNDNESSEGEHQGFFAGITPLVNLHQIDADGALLYSGFYARSTGTATIANGVLDTTHLNIYIQDDNFAAINVFQYDYASTPLEKGINYTVTGMLDQYNGLAQLSPDDPAVDIIDNGAGTMPEALEVNIATLLGGAESLEGLLVKVVNADTVGSAAWPSAGSNANLTISDDSGVSKITLRIDKDTNVDDSPQPTWPQTIIGLLTQFDSRSPLTDGYQLMPRNREDLSGINALPGEDSAPELPLTVRLYNGFPNPFNPSVTIRFDLSAAAIKAGNISLDIYNNLGQRVASLLKSKPLAGSNDAIWNGCGETGIPVASGVYYAVLRTEALSRSVKLVLIR